MVLYSMLLRNWKGIIDMVVQKNVYVSWITLSFLVVTLLINSILWQCFLQFYMLFYSFIGPIYFSCLIRCCHCCCQDVLWPQCAVHQPKLEWWYHQSAYHWCRKRVRLLQDLPYSQRSTLPALQVGICLMGNRCICHSMAMILLSPHNWSIWLYGAFRHFGSRVLNLTKVFQPFACMFEVAEEGWEKPHRHVHALVTNICQANEHQSCKIINIFMAR